MKLFRRSVRDLSVLTDRYIYSLLARAIVRGMDPQWIRSIFSVALKPDALFYLRLGFDQLVPHVVFARGFDYWESGMDLYPGQDMYDNFCNYQAALLAEFDRLSQEFNFETVDASGDARAVFSHLKSKILHLLEADSRDEFPSRLSAKTIESPARRATKLFAAAERTAASNSDLVAAPVPAHASNGNGHAHHFQK